MRDIKDSAEFLIETQSGVFELDKTLAGFLS